MRESSISKQAVLSIGSFPDLNQRETVASYKFAARLKRKVTDLPVIMSELLLFHNRSFGKRCRNVLCILCDGAYVSWEIGILLTIVNSGLVHGLENILLGDRWKACLYTSDY